MIKKERQTASVRLAKKIDNKYANNSTMADCFIEKQNKNIHSYIQISLSKNRIVGGLQKVTDWL